LGGAGRGFQDGSSPDALLQTSAFKNVIFGKDHHGSESVVKKRDIITSESAPERLFFADPIGLGGWFESISIFHTKKI
jgi:hypothetical protein